MTRNEREGGCERRRVTESRYVIPRIPLPSFYLLLRGVGDTNGNGHCRNSALPSPR
jgi:hypothetical protein